MIRICMATSSTRTDATADTAETASVTACPRISAPTCSSPSSICWLFGSVLTRRSTCSATLSTAASSSVATPERRTARVTARYIAPVSR